MNCPLEIPENSQVLLDYGTCKLDAQRTAALERHLEICPSCREFAAGQRALWEAMDGWEAPPVAQDFDLRLYRRIEREMSFWDMLVRPFRPFRPFRTLTGSVPLVPLVRRGLPVAAVACLLVMAGVLIEQPVGSPVPQKDMARVESVQGESVQVEQVEQALDAMEMLNEFSHHVRNEGPESKL